jgi:hypothetical protein
MKVKWVNWIKFLTGLVVHIVLNPILIGEETNILCCKIGVTFLHDSQYISIT